MNNDQLEKLNCLSARGLSNEERDHVWQSIRVEMDRRTPVLLSFRFLTNSPMFTSLMILAVVVLGAGGTAYASDSARPGDILFPVDQVVEKARLAITTNVEAKNELRIRYAEERMKEVEELSVRGSVSTGTTTPSVDDSDNRRDMSTGLELAASVLADVSADLSNETARARLNAIVEKLNNRIDDLSDEERSDLRGNIEVRIGDDDGSDDSRIEIRDDSGLRIRVRSGDDDSNDDSRRSGSATSSSSSATSSSSVSRGNLEIEADVFTDITTVKVERNDETSVFTTSAKTKEAIVAEVQTRFNGLSKTDIEAVLNLEIENRASRVDDRTDVSGKSNDDSDDSNDRDGSSGKGKIEIRTNGSIDL